MIIHWLIDKSFSRSFFLKNRKMRPEGDEWEPQISFEIFARCPKITPKHERKIKPKIHKPTGDESI